MSFYIADRTGVHAFHIPDENPLPPTLVVHVTGCVYCGGVA